MPATMHYIRPQSRVKKTVPLRDHVVSVLETYFDSMKGENPENLYNLVLSEVEHPLLEAVMKFTNNNQSQSAQMLGINRGTFRKKLAFYGML
ncbi:MAG: DNA-binding transcriptional regulator Fis [Gammaproteobacteria bacterium]|nr:DNA-binding transcriptional regulator Fis [Gammaproteobacteria bacterium]